MAAKWYQRGKEGLTKNKEIEKQAKARRDQRGPRRFWLANDTSAKFTLLDNPEFFMHEHNLKLGGKYFNYFTCIQEMDTCPLCEAGDNPAYVMVASVINHKSFTDKDGNVHKNQKQLMVFKNRAKDKILRQLEKREDLKFCVYEAFRGSGQTECSTGEDFEYQGKLNPDKLKGLAPKDADREEWIKPFDYEKMFAPKSSKELRELVGGAPPVGSGDDTDALPWDEETADKSDKSAATTAKDPDEISIDDLV